MTEVDREKEEMDRRVRVHRRAIAVSLILIAGGLLWIYPPACPLGVGLLLWIDLKLDGGIR